MSNRIIIVRAAALDRVSIYAVVAFHPANIAKYYRHKFSLASELLLMSRLWFAEHPVSKNNVFNHRSNSL
ncbi:hypothetical protein D3C76_1178600 [compost metagenome]